MQKACVCPKIVKKGAFLLQNAPFLKVNYCFSNKRFNSMYLS